MDRRFVLPIVLGSLVLAGCPQVIPQGVLDLTVSGLPGSAPAAIVVTGPGGFTRDVTASEVLTVPAGSYAITPATVEVENDAHVGVERFGAAPVAATVVAGATTEATVAYAYEGFTIDDPAGDAVGTGAVNVNYDIVQLRSEIDGTDLVLSVTFADYAYDFSELVGLVDLDVDRDPATGESAHSTALCAPGPDLGIEFYAQFDMAGSAAVYLGDGSDFEPVVQELDGQVVTVVVPLAMIGGDARVHAAATVLNGFELTDCVPGVVAGP